MQIATLPTVNSLTSAEPSSADIQAVAGLFEQLVVIFGRTRFADTMKGGDATAVRREWALGLSGIHASELERGIAKCKQQTFCPRLGEFMHLCRPALDPEYAWHEAYDGLQARERDEPGVWSHPAVWRAGTAMSYDLKQSSFRQQRVRWSRLLSQEFEKGWGEDVPPVEKRVEHRPTLTPMPAAVRKKLADITRKFSGAAL